MLMAGCGGLRVNGLRQTEGTRRGTTSALAEHLRFAFYGFTFERDFDAQRFLINVHHDVFFGYAGHVNLHDVSRSSFAYISAQFGRGRRFIGAHLRS